MLNIPISVVIQLQKSKNILIMGMGGGFDCFGGLPIYFTLKKMGMNVHLANYTQTNWESVNRDSEVIPMSSTCVGVTGNIINPSDNFPEAYLANWLKEIKGIDNTPVWTFRRDQSVKDYTSSIDVLAKHLEIDTILLVDGGVDSIMQGNEDGSGEMMGDTLTLAAIKNSSITTRILSAVGFGTELESRLSHYLALENMANISKQGGFHGSCSLVDFMDSFSQYKEACEYVWNQPGHTKDHAQVRIISSAEGEFGDYHMFPMEKNIDVFISPLSSVYWFFNADAAIYNNKVISVIETQETFYDAVQVGVPMIKNSNKRPRKDIPLT